MAIEYPTHWMPVLQSVSYNKQSEKSRKEANVHPPLERLLTSRDVEEEDE